MYITDDQGSGGHRLSKKSHTGVLSHNAVSAFCANKKLTVNRLFGDCAIACSSNQMSEDVVVKRLERH